MFLYESKVIRIIYSFGECVDEVSTKKILYNLIKV